MGNRPTHYWIDGYNVIKRSELWPDVPMEERRQELVAMMARIAGRFWIVFDSRETTAHGRIQRPIRRVTVEYTRDGMTADDTLVHRAEITNDLTNVLVVSDDQELVRRCRFFGARSLSVREFIDRLEPRSREDLPSKPEDRLSRAQIEEWKRYFGFRDEDLIEDPFDLDFGDPEKDDGD